MAVRIYFFVMTLLVLGGVMTSSSLPDPRVEATLNTAGTSAVADVRLVETRDESARMFQPQRPKIMPTTKAETNATTTSGQLALVPPPLNQILQTSVEEGKPAPLRFGEVKRAETATGRPTWISIPTLEIEAAIVPVGLNSAGQMETPRQYTDVGWYQNGAIPGQPGRSVLAGHLDSFDGPAVFYRLDRLQPGDPIRIFSSARSSPVEYIVRDLALFWTDLAPVEEIFSATDATELVLITCGGPYDRGSASYLQRLVVYATLSTPEVLSPQRDQAPPLYTAPAPS